MTHLFCIYYFVMDICICIENNLAFHLAIIYLRMSNKLYVMEMQFMNSTTALVMDYMSSETGGFHMRFCIPYPRN